MLSVAWSPSALHSLPCTALIAPTPLQLAQLTPHFVLITMSNSNTEGTSIWAPKFPKLNEHNYHVWKFDMQALLQRNSTWRLVKGTYEEPSANADDLETWEAMNMNAAGVIYSQVEPSIQPLIREKLDNAPGMWTTLKDHFAKDNAASRFLIVDEFLSISKQTDESLTSLCARVEDTLQKVCSAHTEALTLSQFEEELAMMTLIHSLPEDFNNFRSSLLLVPGTLSLETVKEAFMQEERN